MNPKRIDQKYSDFKSSLERLSEALAEDPSKSGAIISPRAAIKEAFKQNFITDGDKWIQAMEDRNKTSHLYDESESQKIYARIKADYHPLFDRLLKRLSHTVKAIQST